MINKMWLIEQGLWWIDPISWFVLLNHLYWCLGFNFSLISSSYRDRHHHDFHLRSSELVGGCKTALRKFQPCSRFLYTSSSFLSLRIIPISYFVSHCSGGVIFPSSSLALLSAVPFCPPRLAFLPLHTRPCCSLTYPQLLPVFFPSFDPPPSTSIPISLSVSLSPHMPFHILLLNQNMKIVGIAGAAALPLCLR